MLPIGGLKAEQARGIRFVLFDIDDTITEDGYLLAESYQALWRLRRAGLAVVPVTGRPAGWCDLIARQWPVSGVVGENGAFAFYQQDGVLHRLFHPAAPEPSATRARLDELGRRALQAFPGLRLAKDQAYRLFDIALDFAEEEPRLGLELARSVQEFCEARGAIAKISSIHVNAWFGSYDKLSMAEHFLSSLSGYDPIQDEASILYFGDSPNDEPMFKRFSLSCGVANVRDYAHLLTFLPKYVTSKPYGYGFAEAVDVLLAL
ncbi:MAG TPA: HAD family phosphatase [Spirochaetaceae bacterium]|jgi:HAD superfamily hydrolase (TIGR01484 family)|nr:HAD family phosphatase [Spirochaetaceae bacterium]